MLKQNELDYVKSLLTNKYQDLNQIYKKSKLPKNVTWACLEQLTANKEVKRICVR